MTLAVVYKAVYIELLRFEAAALPRSQFPACFHAVFDLDAQPRRAHNEGIMANNFDPSIGAATRWKKGRPSPNPGGRPKSRLLSEALRAQLGRI